ncbi:MAG: phospho-N-acetylmuramoyl-pentapeptide-transferase [Alphaproteobacteria bacterium]|nr:phospho-N-acetylmuramoyl-pentapeptide-transferase [Alphaproteobacteria bacterium]
MLYALLAPLGSDFILFNLLNSITFRAGSAAVTSLVIAFVIGPRVIAWLKSQQPHGQPIREDGPKGHFAKAGTPTMGGLLLLLAGIASTLLWSNLTNGYVWATLLVTLAYGAIGFVDDYHKLTKRHSRGLSASNKFGLQIGVGVAAAVWISWLTRSPLDTGLALPFFKDLLVDLGWFYFAFAAFVMVGASNAVNLTDGLDGLATVPVLIAAACLGLIAYLVGHAVFANYLLVFHIPGASELAVFSAALVGAALGFLWFNAPPAMVFMGDTGSLSMGGALGAVAVIIKHELVLAIIGGLFVLETVSVIAQVTSFKLTGKRVFRMAPLHHHFEQKGWQEPTIVIRFWIIATVLALAGLATLKIR